MLAAQQKKESIDDAERIGSLRTTLEQKLFLRRFYQEVYRKCEQALTEAPSEGLVIELGAGASFAKTLVPSIKSSDVIPYVGIDLVLDATKMALPSESVRAFFLMNVFHHIADSEAFLEEADRCLKPGGILFIFDQHVGWLSRILLKRVHQEFFDPTAKEWNFQSTGPLSGANGALAWIVFHRDREIFARKFPGLSLRYYKPNSAFRYWLAGGLKKWSLLPGWSFPLATKLEQIFVRLFPESSCFVDILVVKKTSG